jgi:oxygen-independent coproporphyrinogen III oxidase
MAGLYIHIPFCRQLCYYCDFHFTVSLKWKDRLIDSLCTEIESRKNEYAELVFDTIYFGGGTPSILSVKEILKIFDSIQKNCATNGSPEITFEANPDDLSENYLFDLKNYTPINRLSIGVQSFNDADLKLMNRRHTAQEAIDCIDRSKKTGFSNMNIDLIYGIPGMIISTWQNNLEIFEKLDIPHLSAYHLTFEPKTVFSHYLKKGLIAPIHEELSIRQFEMLIGLTESFGYDHYEISNFAKEGFYSQHNLGYWTDKPYIGIGPSAHSYLSGQRRWNVSVNAKYCEALEQNSNDYFESETIDIKTAYNDYLLTSLRTKWGIDKDLIKAKFGDPFLTSCNNSSIKFLSNNTLLEEKQKLFLSKKGILIADYVISEMMITD